MIKLYQGDSRKLINQCIEDNTLDAVITSPPYNIGVDYDVYDDTLADTAYLQMLHDVFGQLKPKLKKDGILYINLGYKISHSILPLKAALTIAQHYTLLNTLCWVKSISLPHKSFGHFKPVNSKRYIHSGFEYIFMFAKSDQVTLDRHAIGVPFEDKTNISRWDSNKNDLRCRGNVWYIPYETVQTTKEHPATFPLDLPVWCIKLSALGPNSLILDPFAGLGTTLQAAEQENINAIGFELSPSYAAKSKYHTQLEDKT